MIRADSMIASLKEGVVEYVLFVGVDSGDYPPWFLREIRNGIYVDESLYTRYIPESERFYDYYDKTVVEDYSVFLRKPDGSVFCTNYDTFTELYSILENVPRTNSGIAAFKEDCIEIVECVNGRLPEAYPEWFFNYFSGGVTMQSHEETILFYGDDGEIQLSSHCVFLRNREGSIAYMDYRQFEAQYVREGLRRIPF